MSKHLRLEFCVVHGLCCGFVSQLEADPAVGKVNTGFVLASGLGVIREAAVVVKYALCLHELVALEALVSLVGSTDAGAVDAPTLLGVVALLGFEFAVVLTLWVVDAVVVDEGRLRRLSSCPGVQALPGSEHLSLHQEALGDH